MKKLFLVLVSILLLTGVAQAVDKDQSITGEFAAQNTSRSRITDSSVILKIWTGDALANPGVGVSASSVLMVYLNILTGAAVRLDTTGNASFDTVGEIVDYINTNFASDSTVEYYASVGNDAYRDLSAACLEAKNIEVPGLTKALAATVETAHSRFLSVGVEAQDDVTPRIKSISAQLAADPAEVHGITLTIYDGNTAIWRKYTGSAAYVSATADAASPNTVVFPDNKGISATKGNSIVAVVSTDANVDAGTTAAAIDQISIVYDKLR